MTIKDVEERTGLSRSNIRFYEKEKLIEPSRNESNGYRDSYINYICLFDYLFISSQMSAKPYFIGSTGILLLW